MMASLTAYGKKLLDPRWQKLRLEVLEESNWACEYCGNTKATLHVHHLCYAVSGNPWDVEKHALMCLCDTCHKIEHLKNLTPLEKNLIEFMRYQIRAALDEETYNFLLTQFNKIILKHNG